MLTDAMFDKVSDKYGYVIKKYYCCICGQMIHCKYVIEANEDFIKMSNWLNGSTDKLC